MNQKSKIARLDSKPALALDAATTAVEFPHIRHDAK
jgi:hypothetical protein